MPHEDARRQGKFWALHDAHFALDLRESDTTMESVATRTDLDMGRWAGRFREESTKERIALNGRRVYDLRIETLQHLIAHELEAAK